MSLAHMSQAHGERFEEIRIFCYKSSMNGFWQEKFYNPTKGMLSAEQVLEEMESYMEERPEMSYEVIVGCDSASTAEPYFPVVVAVLRKGEGGRYFLKRTRYSEDFNKRFVNWRNRILQEILLSCDLALSLRELLEDRLKGQNLSYEFNYIHADIGEKGATKNMVKELTGLIRGNGFEPKIKPEACIASVVAHRYS